jgi:hypothetical protein
MGTMVGGHDHTNTLVQNECASLAFVLFLKLAGIVNNHDAPDGSWINSVERIMQLLNLGTAHQSHAREECATLEGLVHGCNSMKRLRQIGIAQPEIVIEWNDAVEPVITAIEGVSHSYM